MENNPMKIIYQHFGEEKEDNQEVLSVANIFYDMGNGIGERRDRYEEGQSTRSSNGSSENIF